MASGYISYEAESDGGGASFAFVELVFCALGADPEDVRGEEECGMSRAQENADRYGDIVEFSAVFEKGDRGPEAGIEYRAGSFPSG